MRTSSTTRTPSPPFLNDDLDPAGAGRYVQRARGYRWTLVNGEVFMDGGEHTGAPAGRMLRAGGV